MATNTQVKFLKVNGMPSTGLVVGAIYFDKKTGLVNVATSATTYESFGGRISETEYKESTKVLSITKNDGSTIDISFADIASASEMAVELGKLDTAVKAAQSAADAAQADVDAVEKALGNGFSEASTATAQLAAVKATADAAAVKATVDAELAKKANADQVTLDINAAKDAAIAAAATDATGKADAAKNAAIADADGKFETVNQAISALQGALGTGENVGTQIANAIGALDATVGSESVAEGKHVAVQVVEVDGKLTAVNVSESDIASKSAFEAEQQRVAAKEAAVDASISALAAEGTGRVSVLEEQIKGLTGATHFIGVKDALPESGNNGDIVIVGSKEYVYSEESNPKWVLLGDTTAEADAISTLQGTVAGHTTAIGEISADLAGYKTTVSDTYVTKETYNGLSNTVGGHTTKLGELETAVGLNTSARTNHAGRIEALESVANGLATNYVGAAAYATDKQAFEKAHEDLGKNIETVSGNLSTLQGTVTTMSGTQTTQGQAISKNAEDIAALQQQVGGINVGVTKVTGNADVVANPNTGEVALSLNKATAVTSGETKAVTSGAVYEAMCWVEFN